MTGHTTEAMTQHYSHVTLDEKHRALTAALGDLAPARPSAGVDRWGRPGFGGNPSTPDLGPKTKPPTKSGVLMERGTRLELIRPGDDNMATSHGFPVERFDLARLFECSRVS
jgi:hypothetical protein